MGKNKHYSNCNKLSRGPRNPQDRRFRTNEHRIRRVIERALSKRRINLHVQDICRSAGISTPTFYFHCRNSEDALRSYEEALVLEFRNAIATKDSHKEVIFIILLQFIANNQRYFTATLNHHDAWLLTQILNSLRTKLAGNHISDKCFDIYIGKISTLIFCWGKYEHFSTEKIPLYTKKLMQTRFMDLGI